MKGRSEKIFFQPITHRLQNILSRHLPDSEIETFFDNEILPAIDALSREADSKRIFDLAEKEIKANLGDTVYLHYKSKSEDILKILSAGEITFYLIPNGGGHIDLSVKMFPFFKASEVACRKHSVQRYRALERHESLQELDGFIRGNMDNITGKDIPRWFEEHKKAFLNLLDMLLGRRKKSNLVNARNTGISIQIFGRETITIGNRSYAINNIFDVHGSSEAKEALAKDLCELQVIRNESIHETVEDQEGTVKEARRISYRCLKLIPKILEI